MSNVEPEVELRTHPGLPAIEIRGDAKAIVSLEYPGRDLAKAASVEVELSDVRAADGLKIQYDFDRDGWVVYQERGVHHSSWSDAEDGWVERVFIQAWGMYEDCPHMDRDCPECP